MEDFFTIFLIFISKLEWYLMLQRTPEAEHLHFFDSHLALQKHILKPWPAGNDCRQQISQSNSCSFEISSSDTNYSLQTGYCVSLRECPVYIPEIIKLTLSDKHHNVKNISRIHSWPIYIRNWNPHRVCNFWAGGNDLSALNFTFFCLDRQIFFC